MRSVLSGTTDPGCEYLAWSVHGPSPVPPNYLAGSFGPVLSILKRYNSTSIGYQGIEQVPGSVDHNGPCNSASAR